jgi:hypothetical protein
VLGQEHNTIFPSSKYMLAKGTMSSGKRCSTGSATLSFLVAHPNIKFIVNVHVTYSMTESGHALQAIRGLTGLNPKPGT